MKEKKQLMTLELFCGTKSFTKVLNTYTIFDTTTLDNKPIFKPDIIKDILDYEPQPRSYNIIWASPPCNVFSVMSAAHHWNKKTIKGKTHYEPRTTKTLEALKIIGKTIEIISNQKPKYWFIENPRGLLQFMIEDIFKMYGITEYHKKTITYCKYGKDHMKATNIWTNFNDWKTRPICKRGDKCHESVKPGEKRGIMALPTDIHRGTVPRELCQEIIDSILLDLDERV